MTKNRTMLQAGFSMIEVMVALVILMIGLLGLAGLQVQALNAELESYQRVQAIILLHDMVDRFSNNRSVPSCYAFTTNTATGAPFLGTDGLDTATLSCSAGTAAQQALALSDLAAWDTALRGSAGSNVGAMIGAKGCIVIEDATNLIYRISVAWQGKLNTIDPATNDPVLGTNTKLTCGKGHYGDERMRRIVSTTVRIGILN